MEIELRRRFFAEELEAVASCGRWRSSTSRASSRSLGRLVRGPCFRTAARAADGRRIRTRLTPDADPARAHHNIAVDRRRPSAVQRPAGHACTWIDALDLHASACCTSDRSVLHR